ncbi:MAG: hypothetical protein JSS30_02620 [Verrucomicrobia bacterium]|nr:hypothetical protein [Verrucomicrobiota bacterium]
MFKNTLILLAASIPFMGYCDEGSDCSPAPCLIPGDPIDSCQLPVGYLYPAEYALQGCNCAHFTIGAEFIYWQFLRVGALADIGRHITTAGRETVTKTLLHKIGHKPGFRVAAAIALPCFDNWDFDINYTWFHHTTTKNFTSRGIVNVDVINPRNGAIPQVNALSLRSRLKMNLDMLEVLAGRSCYLGKRFIVLPFAGIKSWWSSQDETLTFNVINGAPGTNTTTSGFWGIGPIGGTSLKVLGWCGLYATGKLSVSVPFSIANKYKCVRNFPGLTPAFVTNVETAGPNPKKYGMCQPVLEGNIGLGWGTYFCDCSYHIDCAIKYDLFETTILIQAFGRGIAASEWTMQGLSIAAQLDF